MHLGIVAPLPPTPTGPAESVRAALPLLEEHAQITCFVPDPEKVDAELRERFDIRRVEERDDPSIDMLVYHIGNNPHLSFVFNAILEGPAGLVEVHDGSLHHHLQEVVLGHGHDPLRYAELGQSAHGWAGRRLAELRWGRYRGVAELFLFDYLQPVLDRARGVVVHSKYAEELVQLRCPRVHTWNVPLPAPELLHPEVLSDRSWTGIDEDTLLIVHLGFVTWPKRPDVYVEALRKILDRGVKAHLVFAGSDDTHGRLRSLLHQFDVIDDVTITGYLDLEGLERWAKAMDVMVSLRAPHVGESSGSLSYGLVTGKPVIVQPIGSWAELPSDVVVRMPVSGDDATTLAETLFALSQDSSIRQRIGDRAKQYAIDELDPHRCAEKLVAAARDALDSDWTPPSWTAPSRAVAARTFLDSGRARIEAFFGDSPEKAVATEAISHITPARPRARLLAIDAPARLVQLLTTVWGYDVDVRTRHQVHGEAVILDAQPGVPGCSYLAESLGELQNYPIGFYDVVVAEAPDSDVATFLALCNRVLTPQGSLVVLAGNINQQMLDDAGLSSHQHVDHPGWPVFVGDETTAITVAIKATLPAGALV